MPNDRGIFVLAVLMLLGVGVLMVYSASVTSRPTDQQTTYLTRHLAALAVGGLVAIVAASLPSRFWRATAIPLFLVSTLLLVGVLIPGVGTKVNGAWRWYRWGPVSFQPSELAKITLVLVLARLLAGRPEAGEGDERAGWWRRVGGFAVKPLPIALACGLIVVEPDFGTALLVGVVGAMVLFLGGVPIRGLLLVGGLSLPVAALLAWQHPYVLDRVKGLHMVWSGDWSQAPYQMRQSLLALGSGGLFGVGLGKGWQKLSFLPEANTDFVFAVIGEELGLVGTVTLVLLWIALFVGGTRMLRRVAHDRFAALVALTLLVQLVLQAMINMAVVTALLPPKGIPLPLVSYGGSSLTMSLLAVGIILSLAKADDRATGKTGYGRL
jgi:cell division protein FtsW